MKKTEAIAYFGSRVALAEALKIKPPAISQWGGDSDPEHIPEHRQIQLERMTKGKLKADPACYIPQSNEQPAAA